MLSGLCWDDRFTIAQWLEHRLPRAKVRGSSSGGDSQFSRLHLSPKPMNTSMQYCVTQRKVVTIEISGLSFPPTMSATTVVPVSLQNVGTTMDKELNGLIQIRACCTTELTIIIIITIIAHCNTV